jgi:hypothetical protein
VVFPPLSLNYLSPCPYLGLAFDINSLAKSII